MKIIHIMLKRMIRQGLYVSPNLLNIFSQNQKLTYLSACLYNDFEKGIITRQYKDDKDFEINNGFWSNHDPTVGYDRQSFGSFDYTLFTDVPTMRKELEIIIKIIVEDQNFLDSWSDDFYDLSYFSKLKNSNTKSNPSNNELWGCMVFRMKKNRVGIYPVYSYNGSVEFRDMQIIYDTKHQNKKKIENTLK